MTQIHMVFHDHFDTQKNLQSLMTNLNPEEVGEVAEKIGLMLYGFDILYGNNQWTVYKSHNQIIAFIKKFNKKYKQKLTFQGIQQSEGLQAVSKAQNIVQQQWFCQFCQIQKGSNFKKKSLKMKKKAGGRYFRYRCCNCCAWKDCQIIIRNDGLVYLKESKNMIKQFLHFGKDFSYELSKNFDFLQITIHAYHRRLSLRAKNQKDYLLFIFFLKNTFDQYKKNQQEYRFNSFAPIRSKNQLDMFIDGQDYFQSLAESLQNAKEEVFMCGWWISPEFHLVRPCQGKNLDYRLDNLLRRIAKKNVKIYIIVYFESSFLTNDSAYTKQALEQINENIKVIRHPNIILPTFWSHHEKLIVVDQMVAHMGGLDICYGRYDNQTHSIDTTCEILYPGIQYNNCRVNDFVKVRQYRVPNVERSIPRLPWHDVALKVEGECVKDLSRHFIEYWNYASYQIHYANRYVLLCKPEGQVQKKNNFFNKMKGIAKQLKGKITNEQENNEKNNSKKLQKEGQIEQIVCYSPKNLSNTKKQKDPIKEDEIQISFPELKKKKQSFHQKILSRLTPTKKRSSPKKAVQGNPPSSQNIYNKFVNKNITQRNQKVDDIDNQAKEQNFQQQFIQRKPKQIRSLFNSHMFKDSEQQEQGEKMSHRHQSQIMMHSSLYGEEVSQKQTYELEEKINKFKENLLKMAEMDEKVQEEEEDDDARSMQEDFIKEKDPHRLKSKYGKMEEIQLNENENNKIGNWMNKIIKRVRNSTQNQDNQAKMRRSDISHKNNQKQQVHKLNDRCQILRSASQWSIGCKYNNTQKSIYEGYLSAIKHAKKFIYVQNQFFISATRQGGVVKNKVMEAIADRVITSIQAQQDFRVIIIIPLVPGFAGELDDPNAAIPRVILNWEYRTIIRSSGSLFAKVSEYTSHPEDYIEVYGLRNHGVIENIPRTQIIYLHSKLLIVDDQIMIMGSANINDRSMQGNRDSQLCLFYDSYPDKTIIFFNQQFSVNSKIHTLRTRLWAEHFGMSIEELEDPLHPLMKEKMKNIAKINTLAYRQIFGCYPDDSIQYLSQIKPFKRTPTLEQYKQKCQKICGHIVQFPLFFLCKQKLTSFHPNAIST